MSERKTTKLQQSITGRSGIWLVVLVILLMLHFWFPELSPGTRHDSFSIAASGKKAFYLLSRELSESVRRNDNPIDQLVYNLEVYETLCLLGPARYPKEEEWDSLLDWVQYGGCLVIAAHDYAEKDLKIDQLSIEVKRQSSTSGEHSELETALVSDAKKVRWESQAVINAPQANVVLLKSKSGVQAVVQKYGSGSVVVVASDYIFTNRSMFWEDNSILATQLLNAGRKSQYLVVDEGLNLSGTPKIIGLMFEMPFRPLLIQALILVVLYGWWQHFRFGPLQENVIRERHNIVDHTNAVGMLYYRSNSGNKVVKVYARELLKKLKLRSNKGREERVLAPVAVKLDRTTENILEYIHKVARTIKQSKIGRNVAGDIIHQLSIIRQAADKRKP